MHKALLKSAFLGGLIIFFWEIISWMGLPWHMATLNIFNNETQVAQVIRENTSRPGVYILPNIYTHLPKEDQEKMHEEVGSGKARPMMFASVQPQEMHPKAIPPFIGLLIVYIISAYFVTLIAHRLKPSTYMEKVSLITLLGLTMGIMSYIPGCIWWGFSSGFTMVGMLDLIIEWFLAGLVIAKLSK